MKFVSYNQKLTQLAQMNRNNPTKPEAKIWNELLRGKVLGYGFLRQKPVGNFILDFYCSRLMLGIEIDGDTHAEQEEYDLKRTSILNDFGIKILRYMNAEVMQNFEGVYDDLVQEIKKRDSEIKNKIEGANPPNPLPQTEFSIYQGGAEQAQNPPNPLYQGGFSAEHNGQGGFSAERNGQGGLKIKRIDLPFLKQELRKLGLSAKKSFGQNFLVNQNVLSAIADVAEIQPTETVLEIGPGPGTITQYLIPKARKVIAVELDPEMIQLLQNNLGTVPNLQIIQQNALDYIPNKENYKIVANIPYHITSPFLRHFLLEVPQKPDLVILMIQDEVARKITDPKNESLLSLQVKVFGEPKYLFKVPKDDFFPAPKIDSAVISIQAFDKPLVATEKLEKFFQTVKIGFSQKRKKLLNSFLASGRYSKKALEDIFQKTGIDPNRRPQTLSIEEWKRLAQIINFKLKP